MIFRNISNNKISSISDNIGLLTNLKYLYVLKMKCLLLT